MVLQLYTFPKTHLIVYLQFIISTLNLNKSILKTQRHYNIFFGKKNTNKPVFSQYKQLEVKSCIHIFVQGDGGLKSPTRASLGQTLL